MLPRWQKAILQQFAHTTRRAAPDNPDKTMLNSSAWAETRPGL
jgi:hypothetical protein